MVRRVMTNPAFRYLNIPHRSLIQVRAYGKIPATDCKFRVRITTRGKIKALSGFCKSDRSASGYWKISENPDKPGRADAAGDFPEADNRHHFGEEQNSKKSSKHESDWADKIKGEIDGKLIADQYRVKKRGTEKK